MAKIISEKAASAFIAGKRFSSGNTQVIIDDNRVLLLLHGNCIAARDVTGLYDNFYVTLAGWGTVTTRERVNALLEGISSWYFCQRKGYQMLENRLDAQKIEIDTDIKIKIRSYNEILYYDDLVTLYAIAKRKEVAA